MLLAATTLSAVGAGPAAAQIPGLPEGLQLPGRQPPGEPDGPPAPEAVWTGTVDDRVTALAFSPDGETLAVGTFEAVELLKAADGEAVRTIKTRSGFATALLWQIESSRVRNDADPTWGEPAGGVLTVGDYRRVTRWEGATGRALSKMSGPRGYVTGLVARPGINHAVLLYATCEDGTVRHWVYDGSTRGTHDAEVVVRPLGDESRVPARGLAMSTNRIAVAFGDPDRDIKPGPVFLLDAATLDTLSPLPEHVRAAECVTFSAGGSYVLTGGADEVGRLSHLPSLADRKFVTGKAEADPQPIGRYAGHARPLNAALAIPAADGEAPDFAPIFATGSGGRAKGGNELRVWRFEPNADAPPDVDATEGGEQEAPTGKVRDLSAIGDFEGPVRSLALSADGTLLAVGDDSGAVRVYRVADLLGESTDEPDDEPAPADEPGDDETLAADPEPAPETDE
ncbi:hypothetical protein LzC2_39550 [Planctomycetes bacterium LzC2]|uniref:Anaphase-promoting complex subunit 4-like WD40 domain-containing protein n=1 Tax=Alienimonas chondri TaxID=2681879 RepID=A0ABX1VK83_9PLAN|nr:hypothetical protein [Alienimonas chondri]